MPQADLGGGAEVMLLNFLLGARNLGPHWSFSVFFLRPGPFVEILVKHGIEVPLILDVHLHNPWKCLQTLVQIRRHAKRLRADVILSWSGYAQLFGGLAAASLSTPALWYQISFARGWLDQLATLLPANRILAVSNYVARRQERLWPRRPVQVVWPGIDLEIFCRAGQEDRHVLRKKLGINHDGPLAVMVGRLQRWKGMHTAIRAMAAVRERIPDAMLAIVGGEHRLEPGYLTELNRIISERNLAGIVSIAGLQSNVAEWMSAADVVVHASRQEPFGIVALEAMACGRPVITGDDGGVIEAVRDGLEGVYVPFEDDTRMAAALISLFHDPDAGAAMGLRGTQRSALFSRASYAEKICSALDASF